MVSEYFSKSFWSRNNPQKSNFGLQSWILGLNSPKIWKYKLKSQHLVINLDQGPHLKCAPGHDSIEDSSIMKSYCLKSGIVQNPYHHISFLYVFNPGGKFWKGHLCVASSCRGFCFWKIHFSEIIRHPHFQKVCPSRLYAFFSKMAPQDKPLCSWDAQRNSE